MRKNINLFLVLLFFSFFYIINIKAYTKEDIINLTEEINVCSNETKHILNGVIASYSRLLNERNVSDKDLNKIYNNVTKAINILKNNNVCSVEQKTSISKSIKNSLYNLFNETNNVILSSPKIVQNDNKNNKPTDSKVVIDTSTNQIKIYEDGTLTNAIELEEKLNYVGLNKTLTITISLIIVFFILFLLLKKYIKNTTLETSLLYVLILLLSITIIFRNQLSTILDTISLMKVNINNNVKDVVATNEKIVVYPSYGHKYATIYINNSKGDVYFGDDITTLKKGVGQANSSYLPGEGKKTILSGHNTGVFKELSNLNKEDTFDIETIYGNFKYKVLDIKIVNDDNTDILNQKYDLIMYTCYPNKDLYGHKRIVILANLIESSWIGDSNEK